MGLKMEGILQQIAKDIITPKFASIKHTAQQALEVLQDQAKMDQMEAWEIRQACLLPLKLALESKAKKLGHTALAGIQIMFQDERFRSSMETSDEDKWLPSQVLSVLAVAPTLAEDLQVEVIKLLLNMTITATWCTSAATIIKICQLLLLIHGLQASQELTFIAHQCYLAALSIFASMRPSDDTRLVKQSMKLLRFNVEADPFIKVYVGSYQTCTGMVQGAVQAAMVTMISRFVSGLVESEQAEPTADDGNDVLADFKCDNRCGSTANLIQEVTLILEFLTEKLEAIANSPQGRVTLPLLLEGVDRILIKVPSAIKHNPGFQELLWQRLCPILISLLGEPKPDKVIGPKLSRQEIVGKTIGGSATASNITQSSAKIIYNIAGDLASLVGEIPALRPVLESLFHKMLVFPLPQHKHDALLVVKELMTDPKKVMSILGSKPKNSKANMALIKMLVDTVHQCSHAPEQNLVFTSITCIDGLLASLERISNGEAVQEKRNLFGRGSRSHGQGRRSMTLNPDDDGGSEVTTCAFDNEDSQELQTDETFVTDQLPPSSMARTKVEEKKSVESHQSTFSAHRLPQSPTRVRFDEEEKASAREFIEYLSNNLPVLMSAMSLWEVDEALQELASRFCSDQSHQHQPSSPGATGTDSNIVLNSDGVYVAAITIFKLNMKLINSGHYTKAGGSSQAPSVSETDFVNELFGSGLLLFLPPVWLSEVYRLVLAESILDPSVMATRNNGQRGTNCALKSLILDLEGSGTNEVRGRLMSEWWEESRANDSDDSDNKWKIETGKSLASSVMWSCWDEILDILSVMLNDNTTPQTSMSTTGVARHNLALLLATDSAREDVRRARGAICIALNGLQRAAKLCCILGLQHLCGSAFAQLARTSCMKEDFRVAATAAAAATTAGATVSEGKGQKGQQGKGLVLGGAAKPKLVKLHAAHVLSMDVVMTTGMEMGSHSADCWRHVLRCCAHISELEHTYFSQGNNQSSLPKVMQGSGEQDAGQIGEADGTRDSDLYLGPVGTSVPVAPRINVPALIQQSKLESGWDNSLSGGGVLTHSQASKALCGLSQEVDSLFEDAANKLCLDALLSFLMELCEASLAQVHKMRREVGGGGGNAGTRVAAGGGGGGGGLVGGSGGGGGGIPPTNALHLYRLQQVLIRVVNSSRPLIHLLKVWSVISPYLVQATGHGDRAISKMAVNTIHEFIVSLVSQRDEKAHFHVNEFVCKTFEDMLCLDLCDGDVQDQIVCCICELVEACNTQLHSGWRPLFGALRSVKIEYTTSEAVNEARQRHVAAVMDVFDVYLDMDNIGVFANATVDCVLCLLKYVHGPATFNSDADADLSDSDSDDGLHYDGERELESLCVPALKYLTRVCHILATMWQMPACPEFKGAHRIRVQSAAKSVDPEIPNMDFDLFAIAFSLEEHKIVKEELKVREQQSSLEQKRHRSVSSSSSVHEGIQHQHSVKEETIHDSVDQSPTSCSGSGQQDNIDAVSNMDHPTTDTTEAEESVQSRSNSNVDKVPTKDDHSDAAVDSHTESSEGKSTTSEQRTSSEVKQDNSSNSNSSSGHPRPSELLLSNNDALEQVQQSEQTLDKLDNQSGVLHVWFLLLDGLVSAVTSCPKAFQSCAMTTLVDLLNAAAQTPGPEFSLYCVNHLLLPMLQAWLRRGATSYGFWNTGIVSFKQFSGLVADLVVENISQFGNNSNLQTSLQIMLKQTLDVFIECVAQPVETISRLGCSCLRHILMTAGPNMSEGLWQIGAVGIRRALRVSLYNLRLLMSLFHPNSDNFYGDIGQVKVATRSDCTVIDELRLRQMAKQVFLLDRQVSSMPGVQYDTDQHKSFVFLLYPPGKQDSLNPDHISTRVPFRHVIIGLLANHLLIQTVGSLLLEQGHGQGDAKEGHALTGLPGLMRHMSTRTIYQLLSSMEDVYHLARDFDARPGLKFLLQKVAGLDVAANLYKAAASTTVFYAHALLELCARLDGICMSSTKATLTPVSETPVSTGSVPTIADLKQLASISLAKPWASGKIFLPLLQNMFEEMCHTYVEVLQDAKKGSILDAMAEQPIFLLTAQHDNVAAMKPAGKPLSHYSGNSSNSKKSKARATKEGAAAVAAAKKAHNNNKSTMVSSAESVRSKSTESLKTKSVDSDSEVMEGLGMISIENPQQQQVYPTSEFDSSSDLDEVASSVGGDRLDDHGQEEEEEEEDGVEEEEEEERKKSKRELREDMQAKVYTVATDQVIENLMSQYKRHKHQRSMPNFVRPPRLGRLKLKVPRKEAVDAVIDKQQRSSIMKDSEAHVQAWSDTLTAILQMALNLDDPSFSALLPVVFTLVSQLNPYATDFALRDQLTSFFMRLGRLYDFAPSLSQVTDGTEKEKSSETQSVE